MPSSSGDKLCPICDSPLQPGSKKCGFCGTDLSIFDMDIEAPRPTPGPVVAVPPKPTVESRIEEIFSKPLVPEKPLPARPTGPVSSSLERPRAAPPEVREVEDRIPAAERESRPAAPMQKATEKAVEYFECPQCGSLLEATASSCPKCGVLFAEEGAEMFQCPACNTLVNLDAKSCPGCGAVFVEAEEEAPTTPAPPPVKKDLEPPVTEVKAPPKAAHVPPKEEEKKGLFGGLFKKGRKEEEPAPKPSKPVVQEKPAPALPKKSVEDRPHAEEVRRLRPEPTPAPAVKDKGKELARMVAEMKPLLSLAREKDVDIGESKQLIDEAAVAGRERQLDKAIDFVLKSKNLLMREIDTQLAKEIAHLNEEIRVAREFGGDISRASTYVQEVARARSSGDVEAAYVYVDKVKKELLPITGRYNESKKKLANFKQLISDAETFLVDTKEARGLLVDAAKAMDTKDFDRLETLIKTAQERLYMAIPSRMNDEMQKAKSDLLDAKMRNINITPMITTLKSATNLMKAGDYAQALREMREFKEMMKKPK